jgi:hypothetical protein
VRADRILASVQSQTGSPLFSNDVDGLLHGHSFWNEAPIRSGSVDDVAGLVDAGEDHVRHILQVI